MSLKPTRPPSAPATWTADAQRSAEPKIPHAFPGTLSDLRGYAFAIGGVIAALVLTRLTWPFFARAPFFPVFGVIFVASQWLPEGASLAGIVVATIGASMMAPAGDVAAPEPWVIAAFAAIALTVNRMLAGRKRVATALRASEGQFRAAWSHVAFGAALLNAHGQVERINPAMERLLGYPGTAWAGVPFAYFCLDDVAEERARFTALMAGGEPFYQREQAYRRADGASIRCLVTMSVIDAGKGSRATGALMVLEDVTDRRRAEEALRTSEHHYRQLFRDNPQAMWVYDVQDQRFLAVNDAAVARYGYTAAEFQALTLADLVEFERHAKIDAVHSSGRHRTKDGRVIDVQVDGSPVQWSGRSARLELVHDVTERAQLREQLSQSQKMEAIGQLAGGIAHDFNNLLTTIQGYADLLLSQIGPDKPMWQDLHEIQAAAASAGMLTHQLLSFSRRQPSNLVAVDVNGVVARLSQMLRRVIPADIEVQVTLGEGRLTSKVDGAGLEQVLMNLVLNARDAIRGGKGRISIRTNLATLGHDSSTVTGGAVRAGGPGGIAGSGQYVVLEVTDNGSGMDAVTKARVFEPFFTTKTAGMGTGLGLAVVYGIVQQAGGHLEVESAVGRGTTFRAFLPWTSEAVRIASSSRAAPESLMGSESVLLVEDSAELRMLVSRVLKRHGYHVHDAGTADEALALAQQPGVTVDFILMDVVMPRMPGPEILSHLRSAWPGAVVLYVSGHLRDELAERGIRTDDAELLAKPFSAIDLLTRMRRLLDCPTVSK